MSVIGGKTQFPIRAVISSLLETGNVLCPEMGKISSQVANSIRISSSVAVKR
jgi:hypothetical protein